MLPNIIYSLARYLNLGYLNLGMTFSVRQRMVVITTSRLPNIIYSLARYLNLGYLNLGTEEVQLTSNIISSVLK